MNMEEFDKRLSALEDRNAKIDVDKRWHISLSRRLVITLFTYLTIGLYLQFTGLNRPWAHAVVPAVAYMLSTLTLSVFENIWLLYKNKK